MSIEIVNGYPCKTCTDVEYAKKGIDPAHPKDAKGVGAPEKADEAGKTDAAKAVGGAGDLDSSRGPAVQLGGALAQVTQAPASEAPQPYTPGTQLDLFA
jgi:hypothetical protein